jgi:hypothetical protein
MASTYIDGEKHQRDLLLQAYLPRPVHFRLAYHLLHARPLRRSTIKREEKEKLRHNDSGQEVESGRALDGRRDWMVGQKIASWRHGVLMRCLSCMKADPEDLHQVRTLGKPLGDRSWQIL